MDATTQHHYMKRGAFMIAMLLLLSGCARFGAEPSGDRLDKLQHSQHYSNGEFHNLLPTPVLKEGVTKWSVMWGNMTSSAQNLQPDYALPTIKTDLKSLDPSEDTLVWLGHSSFFVQLSGVKILVDPVLSGYASPVSFAIPAFKGTTLYSFDDIPAVDVLLISHDHWDHLDYDTVKGLQSKISEVVVPLGVGAHFEKWGYDTNHIHEQDWYDHYVVTPKLSLSVVPSRHYSGRSFSQNKTLWGGFVLLGEQHRLYLSGDSGYGPHFKSIGQKYGPFNLVALDMGQYDPRWPYIHMAPKQAALAASELNTDALLPAHVGRFSLAQHEWREPFQKIVQESQNQSYRLLTPEIGQAVRIGDTQQGFSLWWNQESSETTQ